METIQEHFNNRIFGEVVIGLLGQAFKFHNILVELILDHMETFEIVLGPLHDHSISKGIIESIDNGVIKVFFLGSAP